MAEEAKKKFVVTRHTRKKFQPFFSVQRLRNKKASADQSPKRKSKT